MENSRENDAEKSIQNAENISESNFKNNRKIVIKTSKKRRTEPSSGSLNQSEPNHYMDENGNYTFDDEIGSFERADNTSGREEEVQLFEQDEKSVDYINNNDENEKSEHFRLVNQRIFLNELLEKSVPDLINFAKQMGIRNLQYSKKEELIEKILRAQSEAKGSIYAEGVFDSVKEYGYLRFASYSYVTSDIDVYVAPTYIKGFGLKTGDTIIGTIRPPNKNNSSERYFALENIEKINFSEPNTKRSRVAFENLIPIYPDKKIKLEHDPEKYSTRILDLFAPIGTGQRALIVAPPKAGKTLMLQEIANGINKNHPDFHVIILLIDERPEEVTDMKENVPSAEVIASTFDEKPERHIHVAEVIIEKAKRLVEEGRHVVILLDSITRLARAYNLTVNASGKVLSGGVDASALHLPKKFFGAARNIRNGGSLTILATALVETGSKMDDVIFEEFKGTGNSEVILLRKLADRRIFPAIDLVRSSTRKEDLLLSDYERERVWALRKVLADMVDEVLIAQKVLDRMRTTKDNKTFLEDLQN